MERRIASVLCATDFSAHSREAVARTAWLPLARGASVTLLHVLPAGLGDDVESRLRAAAVSMMAAAEALLDEEAARAGNEIERFTAVTVGPAADTVIDRAHRARAELVVAGHGERRTVGERLLGATAERIVRGCDSNVLLVARAPDGPYRKPLVAVDLSEVSRHVLDLAQRLVPEARELPVLHAWDAPWLGLLAEGGLSPRELAAYTDEQAASARAHLDAWLRASARPGVTIAPLVARGDARRLIPDEAERRGADLIAVGGRRHTRIGGLLLGSVSERIARTTGRDLVVVR